MAKYSYQLCQIHRCVRPAHPEPHAAPPHRVYQHIAHAGYLQIYIFRRICTMYSSASLCAELRIRNRRAFIKNSFYRAVFRTELRIRNRHTSAPVMVMSRYNGPAGGQEGTAEKNAGELCQIGVKNRIRTC